MTSAALPMATEIRPAMKSQAQKARKKQAIK
jgi:hypothetical protein